MFQSNSWRLAALLAGGLALGACGGSTAGGDVKTTTPSSMLGTDSAATKVGGIAPAALADSASKHDATPPGTDQ
ncbi:MAG: hypothetical protein EOO36_12320 [Cytophagaceae bacterium]|nr:MAG: hypothetical protein EOO36_12320 [Cytophagaceae bacterium]